MADDHNLVIWGGGDGSVSSVVDLLVSSEVALGLFAVGHRKRLRPNAQDTYRPAEGLRDRRPGQCRRRRFGRRRGELHVNVTYVGLGVEVTQAFYSPECVERLYEK